MTLAKLSTKQPLITPCCIVILNLISVYQKLGKGPLHAHKVTRSKTNTMSDNDNTNSFSYYQIAVLFRALPAYQIGDIGQLLLCASLPSTKSLSIYTSWHGGWQYKWMASEPCNRQVHFLLKANQKCH